MKVLARSIGLTAIAVSALTGLLLISGTSFAAPCIVGHSGAYNVLPTFDFTTGVTTTLCTTTASNDRGSGVEVVEDLPCWGTGTTVIYYTSASGNIQVAPYGDGTCGSGIAVLGNPGQSGGGIQDLDYADGYLYAMTDDDHGPGSAPVVYAMDPCTGEVIYFVDIQHASRNADGFTVLPNGVFLINDGALSPTYRGYDASGAPTGLVITLPGAPRVSGVDYDSEDNNLYFYAQYGSTRALTRTNLTGTISRTEPVDWTKSDIGDISVVHCPSQPTATRNATWGEVKTLYR